MNDIVLAILSFFIVLIPLVIIHELGHFFAAKSVGITVLEFGIGIPPRALTLFRKGDTIYTLNWIPLGGFVRPYGEDFVRPKTEEEMKEDLSEIEGRHIENAKSVFEAGPWERIWFLFAGPLANILTAFVVFIIIGALYQPYYAGEVTTVEILPGSPAETAGLQAGDVVTHINGERIQTLEEFNNAVDGQDTLLVTVKRGDESQEITVIPAPFQIGEVEEKVLIAGVGEDTPAEDAELEVDDVVLAVDGISVTDVEMLQEYTREHEDIPVEFTIQRGETTLELTITPTRLDGESEARIGILIEEAPLDETIGAVMAKRDTVREYEPAENAADAFEYGANQFIDITGFIITAPAKLISGAIPLEQGRPAGPVTISRLGGESIKASQEEGTPYPVLILIALISLALAFTNLLPIPALDGGRILFVVIELLRGKPLSPEREGLVHFVGMIFLLSLMLIIVFFEVVDPVDFSSF